MKILLDNHHGIGDIAMFLSVLQAIKKHMPGNEIHMLIKSPVEQNLVETVGGVSKFYYYDPLNHSAKSVTKLILDLRKNKYDLGICHIGTSPIFGAGLMRAIGCKKSIGTTTGKNFINYTVPIDTSIELQRARKNALLLQGLGITDIKETGLLKDLPYKGEITNRIKGAFRDNPIIGICIGTGNTVIGGVSVNGKKWPDQYWISLIERFIYDGYKIVVFGGNKEKEERIREFDDLPNESVIDLVGKVKLSESLEAISNCDLLIAGDTGLGFCSALMDIPTLSLLGPSGPMLACPYGKYVDHIFLGLDCSPCYGTERMRDCKNRRCMNEITVEMVYERSIQLIKTVEE